MPAGHNLISHMKLVQWWIQRGFEIETKLFNFNYGGFSKNQEKLKK